MKKNTIPISIISGFLGCGKTTFINRIVHDFPEKKIGVIVNEFGKIPVESHLINNSENQIIELNTGCMCCLVRKDIISAAQDLISLNPDLDYLFVETSGLSDPLPVAQTFIHNDLNGKIKLDTIINLIDSSCFMQNFSQFDIIMQQTRLADFVFLTKLHLAHERSIEYARAFVKNLGKKTKVYELTEEFEINKFFEIIDLVDKLPIPNEDHHQHNDTDIEVINFETENNFDLHKFEYFYRNNLDGIIRAKGIIYCHSTKGRQEKFVFQAVAEKKELIKQDIAVNQEKKSILIIIGISLDKEQILNQLKNCLIE
ncbi:MAG: GTP-binding protein [Spirochaetes bacterium]|nr:GTP-binding protein [Spirochaetota bacterium]